MLDKYIFNEDIKRVFSFMKNSQFIKNYILKDYISDIKIINENKKKIIESNSNIINNSKSMGKYDSSQNSIALNNLASKNNTSQHHVINVNNSYLYLNSSFRSLSLDKLEGLIFECRWKKKYILLLKIVKINDAERFFKNIEIECIEMNHLENAFNFEVSLFWDSTAFQTLVIMKFTTKYKIIEEIIRREINNKDKKIIYDNMCKYLYNDLTNIEHCSTSLIFASMKEISSFLSDIEKVIKLSPGIENKKLEIYTSPLISTGQNCRVYELNNNKIYQELILSGYYADKDKFSQMRWEKKVNNKNYCIYRLSIIYLEENLSLMIFRNIWLQHVPSQMISEVDNRKKMLFDEIKNYFIKKNGLSQYDDNFYKNVKDMKLNIGIKNYQKEDKNIIDLDMFIHNEGLKHLDSKNKKKENDNEYDSLFQNSNINISNYVKNTDNLFTDTIQNISEIENMNSNFFFGMGDETNN